MGTKKLILLIVILGITTFSVAFYTTNEAVFIHSADEDSFDHLSFLNLNIISPAPKMDTAASIEEFDARVDKFLNRWDIKGASVAVMKDNRLIYAKGYGYANLEEGKKVNNKSLFRIASASKLVTAIGIMKLKDDGLLDLNEKVFGENGILSDYREMKDENHLQITVGDLLNHHGGWSWRDGDFMFQSLKIKRIMELPGPPSSDDIINFVLKHRRLRYKPGTQYAYSNFGYMLLGKIIEYKSGVDYEKYINQTILEPNGIFGMRIAGNYEWERMPFEVHYYNYPTAYQHISFDGSYEACHKPYGGSDITTLGAAGGWIANASQMAKLVSLVDPKNPYYNILTKESIYEMTGAEKDTDAFGWKGTKGENWWRTGTLAGTSCFIYRKANGYTYSVLLNSSVWMGAGFNKYIKWMMDDAIEHFEGREFKNYFWENRPESIILPLSS
ncbi:beta-lactamase family protein [Marivirga sp. S37H4]|uniref:Beta-lactamase family protein n=1 Tax=Marivirga aurantiaca TaxID=2802615 RepID=A0A935C7J4_9BACT|nr:serine hydrolase domain-containing protein [Marivirga aurantiaca]MBK6264402.1 beta-lactamase family protein [Marivirga aurantiaca]